MSFVIRRKSDGKFASGRDRYSAEFVANLDYARVYTERGHAVNSMRHTFAVLGDRRAKPTAEALADLEIVQVRLITSDALESLEEYADKLSRLEAYGVDNWQGYCDAINDTDGCFRET